MEQKKMIEGSKIVRIRAMTDAEYKREYWDNDHNAFPMRTRIQFKSNQLNSLW